MITGSQKKHNIVQKHRPLERKLSHVNLIKGNITLCVCLRACVRACVRVRVGPGGGITVYYFLCDCCKIKRMYNFDNCSHVLSVTLLHRTMQYDNGKSSLCKK